MGDSTNRRKNDVRKGSLEKIFNTLPFLEKCRGCAQGAVAGGKP